MTSLNNQNNQKLYIVWIDKNIFSSSENMKYLEQLGYEPGKNSNNNFDQETMINIPSNNKDKNLPYIPRPFQDIKSSIFYLKGEKSECRFKKTIIIVSGRLFEAFVKEFNNNLKDIYIIPKIIVFTNNRNFEYPNNIPNKEFYKSGGYKNNFDEIKYFLESEVKKIENYPPFQTQLSSELNKQKIDDKLIFERVKGIEDIALNTYFKMYLDLSNLGKNKQFIKALYEKYEFDGHYVELLDQIKDFQDIPVELLSKYYIRLYTIEGDFYRNMKIELLADKSEFYKPYIKSVYAGVEKGALKKYIGQELYSAQKLSPDDIEILQNHRVEDLPNSIIFSKAFISFSKEKSTAESYLTSGKNAILTILKSEDDYDLQTHADIKNLSVYESEKEVLFFPLSTFGVNNFSYNNQLKRYELQLIYFGKFMKDKRFNNITKNLPETKFKKYFEQLGLNKSEDKYNLNTIQINDLNKNYDTFKENKGKKCNKKCFFLLLLLLIPIISIIAKIKSGKSDDKNTNSSKCKEGTYIFILYILNFTNLTKIKISSIKKKKYLDLWSFECLPCSIGYYSAEASNSYSCSRCPYGQSSSVGSSSCFNCSAGTFSDFYNNYCVNCSAGTYSPSNGSSSCIKCPSGKYSNKGAKECITCKAGYFSKEGSGSCSECGIGYFSSEGSSECTKCPNGTYSNISNASSCIKCPPGTSPNSYRSECINCSEGYYSIDNSECYKCPNGTYSNIKGATSCISCPVGSIPNKARTSCIQCAAGYFSNIKNSTECFKCPIGTYSNITGATSCTICPIGTVPNKAQISCIKCPPGYYSNITGATECLKCPIGTYSNITGAKLCYTCPKGTIINYLQTSCIECSPGYYSNITGATECLKCPNGTYSNITGATSCITCPPGTVINYLQTSCIECLPGYFNKISGSTICEKCPVGTYSNITGATKCNSCPKGSIPNYLQTSCIQCSPGYYSNTTNCNKCPDNTYSDIIGATSCKTCPKGMLINSLQTTYISCSNNYSLTSECSGGFYLDDICSSDCTICPAGTVSTYHRDSCSICPKGYY